MKVVIPELQYCASYSEIHCHWSRSNIWGSHVILSHLPWQEAVSNIAMLTLRPLFVLWWEDKTKDMFICIGLGIDQLMF
ncbi:hypothetical protein DAI22_12g006300 [Oryza sativa Japonica Group]|nr:hypothetical protein DAI22_12g006300 [Oryza sativa Japonica Group]